MFKALTTVSPLDTWSVPSTSTILRVTEEISSVTKYSSIGSVYEVINGTILEENDNKEEEYTPYRERPETYIVPVVFLLILLIGLTGNGVLVLTILRHRNMRNVPNIYVFSLALGDLLARVHCYSTRYILFHLTEDQEQTLAYPFHPPPPHSLLRLSITSVV